MINQLANDVVRHCAHIADGAVIDYPTAKKIATAYQWGWTTVWFASEGEIGHHILGGRWRTDPAAALMHALFGWWQRSDANPDGTTLAPGEAEVIEAMRRYLTTRVENGDTGPVPGWHDLPTR